MPGGAPARTITVPAGQRPKLEVLAKSTKSPWRVVQRARMVLLAEQGLTNLEIAVKVGCVARTVSTWRRRFAEDPRVEALADAPRPRHPSHASATTPRQRSCRPPKSAGRPYRARRDRRVTERTWDLGY